MPVEFQYRNGIVYGAFKSPLSLDAVKDSIGQFVNSGEFAPDSNTLWDLRALDFTTVDRELELQLIEIRKQYPERGEARIAFVTGDDPLAYGMTRMYEMLSGSLPQQMRVFKDFAEAEAWLLPRQTVVKADSAL